MGCLVYRCHLEVELRRSMLFHPWLLSHLADDVAAHLGFDVGWVISCVHLRSLSNRLFYPAAPGDLHRPGLEATTISSNGTTCSGPLRRAFASFDRRRGRSTAGPFH